MLKLTGYMEGDLAATFAARAPGDAPYRLVGVEDDGVAARTLEMPLPPVHLFNAGISRPASYLVFRRVEEGGVVHFVIEESRFPDR